MQTPASSFGNRQSAIGNVVIIAHRGLHTQCPENSLAAFAAAEAAGISYLECDVWPSRDGVPVILHDKTLDRTTTGHGHVCDHTAAELAALGVPSLGELIAQSKASITLVVEIKPDDSEDFVRAVVDLLVRQHPLAIVQSFDFANVQHSQRLAPALPVAMLIEHTARLRRPWPVPIHVRHDLIEPDLVESYHAAGLAVGAWTVNKPAEIRTMLVLGVDRIISDDPLLCENLKSEISNLKLIKVRNDPMTLDYATPTTSQRHNPIVYWAAVGLAILSIALIYLGGLVTSYGAGMAVPDWPATNGYCMFAFPISKWVGGIWYEHSHRLLASGVGFYTLVLCGIVFYTDRRKWVRWFAVALLLAVAIQGTLGGLRVVLSKLDLAIVHGCAGQVFLCMVGTFAVMTSRFWANAPSLENATSKRLLKLSLLASAAVLGQLIIGAIMRHKQAGLAIPDFPLSFGLLLPPTHIDDHIQHLALRYGTNLGPGGVTLFMVWIHFAHRLWAVVVSGMLVVFAIALLGTGLAKSAWVLLALLATQLTLGILTVLLRRPADITSLHVAVGSVTLLQTWIITLKCWRLHRPAEANAFSPSPGTPGEGTNSTRAT